MANSKKSISTDEGPSLRIESCAIINLRGVSTKLNKYNKKSISYTGGSKRCNLCLEEKLSILKEKDNCLLNKRSEIVSACQHKNKFQVKNLNKQRHAILMTTLPRFLLDHEHKNSSHFFEICLPP